jgi:hypothetical protein
VAGAGERSAQRGADPAGADHPDAQPRWSRIGHHASSQLGGQDACERTAGC